MRTLVKKGCQYDVMYSHSAAVPAGVCCLGNPPATNLFPHTHTLPAIEKQNTADSMNKDSLNKKREEEPRGRGRKRGVKEGEGNEKERKKRERRRGKMVDVEEEKRESGKHKKKFTCSQAKMCWLK